MFLRERDMRIWFLSTVVEDHHRFIVLWVVVYDRGLWLLGWFVYVKGIGQVYGYKGVAAYVGICGV